MIAHELVQRVQSLYSKGVESDDSRLTSRHIYNKLTTVRSKLISQKVKKKQKISQWNYQTISCIKLERVSLQECDCLNELKCNLLRTENPIPKPLTDLNRHLIQSVTSFDGSVIYSETSWKERKYKSFNRYTSQKPDYFIRNNYLYLTNDNQSDIITIDGLFEDVLAAINYPSYCDENENFFNCKSPLSNEFPIDNDLIDVLIEMSVNELVIFFNQNTEDLDNNSRDKINANQVKNESKNSKK